MCRLNPPPCVNGSSASLRRPPFRRSNDARPRRRRHRGSCHRRGEWRGRTGPGDLDPCCTTAMSLTINGVPFLAVRTCFNVPAVSPGRWRARSICWRPASIKLASVDVVVVAAAPLVRGQAISDQLVGIDRTDTRAWGRQLQRRLHSAGFELLFDHPVFGDFSSMTSYCGFELAGEEINRPTGLKSAPSGLYAVVKSLPKPFQHLDAIRSFSDSSSKISIRLESPKSDTDRRCCRWGMPLTTFSSGIVICCRFVRTRSLALGDHLDSYSPIRIGFHRKLRRKITPSMNKRSRRLRPEAGS